MYAIIVTAVAYSGYHYRGLADAKQLNDLKQQIAAANLKAVTDAKQAEEQHVQALNQIQQNYQKQIQDIENEQRQISSVITSTIPTSGLWVDVDYGTCKSSAPAATSGAATRHCRLSAGTATRLSTLAYKADQDAAELNECLKVINDDRKQK
jgi:membrane-associated HD superfamily phosphohydrolase